MNDWEIRCYLSALVPLTNILGEWKGTRHTFLTASSNDDLISARLALLILTLGNGSVASSPCPFELVSTTIPVFSAPDAGVDALLRAIVT